MKGVGMLCVEGVIYHTLRYQAGRTEPRDQLWSALIWSADHGRSWQGDTTYAARAEEMTWLFQEEDRGRRGGFIPRWGTGMERDCRYDPRLPVKWIEEATDGVTVILNFSDRTRSDVWNHQEVRLKRGR